MVWRGDVRGHDGGGGWAGRWRNARGELAAAHGDVSMGWPHRKSMSRRIWARRPAREEDLDSPSMSRMFWTNTPAREDPAHVRTDLDTPRPCGGFGRPMPCVQRFGQGNPAPWRFWTRPTEGTWEGWVNGWVGECPRGATCSTCRGLDGGGDPWCLAPLSLIICTGMLAAARKAHRPQKSINWFEFVTLVERET